VTNVSTTLRDVSITPIQDQSGAFVIWQTQVSNSSIYVSQISASGLLDYVRELNYSVQRAKYLTVSMDFDNNIDLMWYQPSLPIPQTSQSIPAFPTNVTYLRMNLDGVVTQSGTTVFQTPIIAATVLSDGRVYGVTPDGLVRAGMPIQERKGSYLVTAVALMSCVSLAGVAGSTIVEEGRYRWVSLYSRILRSAKPQASEIHESLKLLSRKPGLKVREINRLSGHRIHLTSLSRMEQSGMLASVRDGLSRRFYVKPGAEQIDALRSRILLWIHDHPGIWEAQLAKDLGLSQQLVHYHLKKLRETKLITSSTEQSGGRKLYRFADNARDRQEPPLSSE
jgi:DNA-binding transcriptional ArsR family regulator